VLAYEFFLKNRNSQSNAVKSVTPIKKIFVTENNIIIDPKTREEYGSELSSDASFLQDWLSMPLNISKKDLLNLPDRRTGMSQRKPYIYIYGTYKSDKSKETIELGIQGKTKEKKEVKLISLLNLSSLEEEFPDKEPKIFARLNMENYMIGDLTMYDAYVKTGIVTEDGYFSAEKFIEVSKAFFQDVKARPKSELLQPRKRYFQLVILPGMDQIRYLEPKVSGGNPFVDCFGVKGSGFASKTTQTAKFMSYDDRAFTINCKQGHEFYENVGISRESLERINLPAANVLNISGLKWIFADLSHPDVDFQNTRTGIYSQLFHNHKRLQEDAKIDKIKVQMKIVCFKLTQQTKFEILIDENLTMDRLEKITERSEDGGYPYSLEVLIEKSKSSNKTIWSNYINSVHNLIIGNYVDRSLLIMLFIKLLREEIYSWIKDKQMKKAGEFFSKTSFCSKILIDSSGISEKVTIAEKYAYNTGLIAGKYVKFKRDSDEESNMLNDILTYSKYDRERLRHVLSRVGQGVNLSNAKQSNINQLYKFIHYYQQEEEIPDSEAYNDYSYFFYKGVFKSLGGE
jgi:hypothetical protein